MVGPTITFDTVLDLCRDQHRRIVLAVLAEEQRSVTVDDLTMSILAYTQGTTMTKDSDEVRTQIRLTLHHTHIPKLESTDLIDKDPERQLVEPTARFDRVQPYLSAIIELDPDLEYPIEV